MNVLQCIKTVHIKLFLTKKQRVEAVEDKIRALKAKLVTLKEDKQSTELSLIDAMERGVQIMSKQFALQVKPHDTQPYINWRKEFETFDPIKYEEVAGSYKRNQYKELIVAVKEV